MDIIFLRDVEFLLILGHWDVTLSYGPKMLTKFSDHDYTFLPFKGHDYRFLPFKGHDYTFFPFKGHDYTFLPFGSGRRVCPGMHLGVIKVKQIVAQLVHSFEWKLPNGISVDDVNMDEKFGLSLPREHGLCAMPSLRL